MFVVVTTMITYEIIKQLQELKQVIAAAALASKSEIYFDIVLKATPVIPSLIRLLVSSICSITLGNSVSIEAIPYTEAEE